MCQRWDQPSKTPIVGKLEQAETAAQWTDWQLKIHHMETPLQSNNELAHTGPHSETSWQAVLSE